MKDTLYLICTRDKVDAMRKTMPDNLKRHEFVIKVNVEVTGDFKPPAVERTVRVEDWREGIDVEDVEFNRNVITEEEAEMIKQSRLEKMKEILRNQGYEIIPKEELIDEE